MHALLPAVSPARLQRMIKRRATETTPYQKVDVCLNGSAGAWLRGCVWGLCLLAAPAVSQNWLFKAHDGLACAPLPACPA